MSPSDLAKQYFAHMRAGDLGVVDLFHDDAVLRGLGRITRGREERETRNRLPPEQPSSFPPTRTHAEKPRRKPHPEP